MSKDTDLKFANERPCLHGPTVEFDPINLPRMDDIIISSSETVDHAGRQKRELLTRQTYCADNLEAVRKAMDSESDPDSLGSQLMLYAAENALKANQEALRGLNMQITVNKHILRELRSKMSFATG